MPSQNLNHTSPYTTNQLYALVKDVKSYPEFLPWVAKARILKESDVEMEAELLVKFKIFKEKYTSKILLNPPEKENAPCSIKVSMIEGPFKHLENNWKFTPDPENNGTTIEFHISFEFSSKMLNSVIQPIFEKAFFKMLEAFENRADVLYSTQ